MSDPVVPSSSVSSSAPQLMHHRTITSMLSPLPPFPSSIGELDRSHSVPGEIAIDDHIPLQPPIISQPLADTHGGLMGKTNQPTPTTNRAVLKAFDPLGTLSPASASPNMGDHAQYLDGVTKAASAVEDSSSSSVNLNDVLVTPPSTSTSSSLIHPSPDHERQPLAGKPRSPSPSPSPPYIEIPVTPTGSESSIQISSGPNSLTRPSDVPSAASTPVAPKQISKTTHVNEGDKTVSSISSYSSATLSSGSFTAFSVSPIPTHENYYHVPSDLATLTSLLSSSSSSATDTSSTSSTAASAPAPPPVAPLSIVTPPSTTTIDSPHIHGSLTSPFDSSSSRHSVRFAVEAGGGGGGGSHERGSGHLNNSDTPSMVRVHEDDSSSPYIDSSFTRNTSNVSDSALGLSGLISPSYPSTSHNGHGESPRLDSPLPPVVSALMAAQKVAGCNPGTTLSLPAQSHMGRLIFLSGDASGAGKSSVAMGLLHLFLKRGYSPKELAYIKPCTQCEDVQIISKFCEEKGIEHQGLGPVIFYEGFTAEVIDGTAESIDKRRARITKAVNKIAEGKKWVLVDGVGYAAVGSVAGVSNAEVASLLNAPVLIVGRPGIGNAIDSMNFMMAFFEKYHVYTLGACWNKVPPMHSYHSYEDCKKYVTKYFRQHRNLSTYGHIPLVPLKTPPSDAPAVVCRLRTAKTGLAFTEGEREWMEEFFQVMEREFDIEQLLGDLAKYYQAHRVQLVSVV